MLVEGLVPERAEELERLGAICPEQTTLQAPSGEALALPPRLGRSLEARGWRTLGLSAAQDEAKSDGPGRGFDLWLGKEFSRGRSRLPYVDAGRLAAMLPDLLAELEGSLLLIRVQDPLLPWIPRAGFADEALLETHTLPAGARRPVSAGFDEAQVSLAAGKALSETTLVSWEEARRSELRFLDHELSEPLSQLEAPIVLIGQAEASPIWLAGPQGVELPEQAGELEAWLEGLAVRSEG